MADTAQTGAYRVLARKYRPRSFEDLIGQEAMVRTLRNAFASDRIHQAYIFTGVRGVGKTTTARIIARALNYELEDGSVTKPTIDMPVFGKHCEAIIESRHVDVIEMDAASNTGVDNIREIIESVRYRPAYARTKVYIIDEVHMLSTSSFNALLKTLEEPPEHVKFIFATTEIRKVPVTVLSRCQRFDLRRIESGLMVRHLRSIAAAESVTIEDEALAMIARAGEGSVRDCLSLMDQAIAHGAGTITAVQVRDMLGLSDRMRVIDLFGLLMKGDIQAALEELTTQYDLGADPVSIVTDLADYVHTVTRLKLAKDASNDPSLTEAEKQRGQAFAAELSIRILTRTWQMLTKGLTEVQSHPRPIIAAEMLLVRIAFAADLPTPDEALKLLRDAQAGGAQAMSAAPPSVSGAPRASAMPQSAPRLVVGGSSLPQSSAIAEPARQPAAWASASSVEEIVALARQNGERLLAADIELYLRPVRVEDGVLEFSLAPGGHPSLAHTLPRALQKWTGRRWAVALSSSEGAPSLAETRKSEERQQEAALAQHPVVAAILSVFPRAKVSRAAPDQPEASASSEDMADATAPLLNDEGDVIVADETFTEDDL